MRLFYSAKVVVRKRNKPSFEGEPLPETAVVPCAEGERWTRFGEYVGWSRDNDVDTFENLPRFWRNVRDNFFFVGPFLEPFVEVFEREEMADGR